MGLALGTGLTLRFVHESGAARAPHMKILAVHDDPSILELLEDPLSASGHELVKASDAARAWTLLATGDISLVIAGSNVNGCDGLSLCQRLRAFSSCPVHFILWTSAGASGDDHELALRAGVDDFLSHAFQLCELRARLAVAERALQQMRIRRFSRLVPICTHCKDVRGEKHDWRPIEIYLAEHVGAKFTHGICPGCYDRVVVPQLERIGVSRSDSAHSRAEQLPLDIGHS